MQETGCVDKWELLLEPKLWQNFSSGSQGSNTSPALTEEAKHSPVQFTAPDIFLMSQECHRCSVRQSPREVNVPQLPLPATASAPAPLPDKAGTPRLVVKLHSQRVLHYLWFSAKKLSKHSNAYFCWQFEGRASCLPGWHIEPQALTDAVMPESVLSHCPSITLRGLDMPWFGTGTRLWVLHPVTLLPTMVITSPVVFFHKKRAVSLSCPGQNSTSGHFLCLPTLIASVI